MGSLSWTPLSDFTFTFHFHALEKEKATHSSILAWKIPWTEEPGGLQSMGVTKESDMTEQLHFLGSFAFLMYFSVFSIFLKMNMFCF